MIRKLFPADRTYAVVTKPFFDTLRVENMTTRKEQSYFLKCKICHANTACGHLSTPIIILFAMLIFNLLTWHSLKHFFVSRPPLLLFLLFLHSLVHQIYEISKPHLLRRWTILITPTAALGKDVCERVPLYVVILIVLLALHLRSWPLSLKATPEVLVVVHSETLWTKSLWLRHVHKIFIIKHRSERKGPDELIENLLLWLRILLLIALIDDIPVDYDVLLHRILVRVWNLNSCHTPISVLLGHRDVLRWSKVLVSASILRHLLCKWRVLSKKLIHKISIPSEWVSLPLSRLNLWLLSHLYRASILVAINVNIMNILPDTRYLGRCVSLSLKCL